LRPEPCHIRVISVTSKEETNQMTDRIKTLLLVAFATISIAGAAHAGVVCNVRDTAGNNLTYAFGENSHNGNGSFGGTMVETGFEKNGQMVISEKGVRPIWIYAGNVGGGYDLYSRANPGSIGHQQRRHARSQRPLRWLGLMHD
jgi:hypothetical protein